MIPSFVCVEAKAGTNPLRPGHCEEPAGRRGNLLRAPARDCFAEPVLGPRRARTRGLAMTSLLVARIRRSPLSGQHFEQVTVRVAKVETAAAIAVIDLHIFRRARSAAVHDPLAAD